MSQETNAQVFDLSARRPPPYVHGSAARDVELDEPVEAPARERPTTGETPRPARRTDHQPRPRRSYSDAELAARDRARVRRADTVAGFQRFAIRHGARAGRGAWIIAVTSLRAPARWVWQPRREEHIDAMTDTNTAARHYETLTRSRARRGAVLVASVGGALLARPLLGPAIMDVLTGGQDGHPWWVYPSAGAALLGACWTTGQIVMKFEAPADEPVLPRGLHDGMSDASVHATFEHSFERMKVEGRVHSAHRAARGWGWIVTAEIVSNFGAKELDTLARLLDTPRGGLLVSMPRNSSRSRVFRVVAVDLLTHSTPAGRIEIQDLSQPVALAPRFDGDDLVMSLAGVHVLVVGRTGSGKSTALWRLVDAFAAGGAKLGGIDLSDGPDLRACRPVFDPRLSAFGHNVADALAALSNAKELALDRKRRLPDGAKWAATEHDPRVRIVIDEYGLLAEHAVLLELVNWLIKYGRNVGIHLVLANQRFLSSAMGGDTTVWSQVPVKFIMALDGNDAMQLPKGVRESGVAPELLVPANEQHVNDAGKSYVIGLPDTTPPLIRFPTYPDGEILRRSHEYAAAGLAQFGRADTAALDAADEEAAKLPVLVSLTRQAIAAVSGKREPARASSAEIVEYLQREGVTVSVATLTAKLRSALGDAYPEDRKVDTNLPGGNFKGWHLDDLERGIAEYQRLNQ